MMQIVVAVVRAKVELDEDEAESLAQVMDECWPDYAIKALLETAGWKGAERE
jgi:hypothetical protein